MTRRSFFGCLFVAVSIPFWAREKTRDEIIAEALDTEEGRKELFVAIAEALETEDGRKQDKGT